MAEHVIEESYKLIAWKGTPGEMADLFERAFQLASEADTGAEEMSLTITLKSPEGEMTFKEAQEFREYGAAGKLARAKKITAHVSAWKGAVRVIIFLTGEVGLGAGASVHVSGTNHVAVSGLTKQLARQLDQGKRHRPRTGLVYLAGCLVAVGMSFAARWAEDQISDGASWAIFGLGLFIAGFAGFSYFTLPILVPPIEILDPADPRTRYERWRGRLLAAAGALLLVVIGAVLQAELD
jgi:hypothetical protein